jgi:hypothetical protein
MMVKNDLQLLFEKGEKTTERRINGQIDDDDNHDFFKVFQNRNIHARTGMTTICRHSIFSIIERGRE